MLNSLEVWRCGLDVEDSKWSWGFVCAFSSCLQLWLISLLCVHTGHHWHMIECAYSITFQHHYMQPFLLLLRWTWRNCFNKRKLYPKKKKESFIHFILSFSEVCGVNAENVAYRSSYSFFFPSEFPISQWSRDENKFRYLQLYTFVKM